MGEALNLNLYPSCYNCLSWSEDGELAVAAGDSVHLQLPQWKPQYVHPLFEKERSMPWTTTKLRTNVFTHREWPVVGPSDRDAFSIGAEQSLSTVSQLAWSYPGVGLHRRCVLGVLTSNLVLSLYEADGQRRTWSRACILNHALSQYCESKNESRDLLRFSRVRSFTWCSPLKVSGRTGDDDCGDLRWGAQLLVIATDSNDIVLVRVRRNSPSSFTKESFAIEVIDHVAVVSSERNYSMIPEGSLWAEAAHSKAKILNISCGPWTKAMDMTDESVNVPRYRALIAATLGNHLQLITVEVNMSSRNKSLITTSGKLTHDPNILPSKNLKSLNVIGPLSWIAINETEFLLILGYVGGRITLRFNNNAYSSIAANLVIDENDIALHQRSFSDEGHKVMGTVYTQHNEPISGIVAPSSPLISQESRMIYLTTIHRFAEALPLSTAGTPLEQNLSVVQVPWKNGIERYRRRYDIQYELGDMSLVRTWGLATFDGWTAVAFTMHPGDVLEYSTRAEENTVVLFTPPEPEAVFPKPADLSLEIITMKRDAILHFILTSAEQLRKTDLRSARLVYSACVRAINANYGSEVEIYKNDLLLNLVQRALMILSNIFELSVDQELTYCDMNKSSTDPALGVSPKPASAFECLAGWVYEKCHTCFRRGKGNVALIWHDEITTVCENGHSWNRCALTFLAIQEPYISMFCSVCDTNFLSHNQGIDFTLDGQLQGDEESEKKKEVYDMLYERYDVCAYCGGKYQDE